MKVDMPSQLRPPSSENSPCRRDSLNREDLHNLPPVSPLSLRRHRAERLLREEFESLRGRVLASARGRPRASGVSVDEGRSGGVLRDGMAGALCGGARRPGDRQPERLAGAGDVPPRDRRPARPGARSLRRRAVAVTRRDGRSAGTRGRRGWRDGDGGRPRARLRGGARRPHASAPAVRGAAWPLGRARTGGGDAVLPAGPVACGGG